jgi:hypothetical protein
MVSKKFKIGVVDKKGKYSFLFQGFRKNKFSISELETVMSVTSEEMVNYNLFFMVLYEYRDVFELLKFRDGGIPAIIASENVKIIKKLQKLNCYPVVDLSKRNSIHTSLHDCMNEFIKK